MRRGSIRPHSGSKKRSLNTKLMMHKKVEHWGKVSSGEEVQLVTLTNSSGASVAFSNYGARVVSVKVPDNKGDISEVVLGYSSLEGYLKGVEWFGCIVGRYANRIGGSRFSLNGKTYQLQPNEGDNHLHSADVGFSHRPWKLIQGEGGNNGVVFKIVSPDGEGGYPGGVEVTVNYAWSETNVLSMQFHAITDTPTVLNLTHHSYFNLGGEDSGSIENHLLQVEAKQYLETDKHQIPTGKLIPVTGTVMDFSQLQWLKPGLESIYPDILIGNGYDHCWVVDAPQGQINKVALVKHPSNGRTMEVRSTLPGVQVYTGNGLDSLVPGRAGRMYVHRDAICIEPQLFPDAPNHHEFPSTVITPAAPFEHSIEYAFTVGK